MATRRLYYDDSYQREFSAQVLNCEPEIHGTTPAWVVILDCTALYPTSGGQPHDLGKIGDANVLDVRDDGEDVVHVVDRELPLGSVLGCVDWGRRFDHMQQHTGQHLLSAMFQERFGRPTVSFHLGSDVCTIDLRGPEPTEEIQEGAERAGNQVISEDRPVTVRYGTAEEFAELGARKDVQRSGILRAIEIEGADLQPCGGTHVKSTSQIGVILVRRCAKMRQDWRVEFVCGRRAGRVARHDFQLLHHTAEGLGCAPEDVPASAQRAVSERDLHFKNMRALLQRLAETDAVAALQSAEKDGNGIRVVARVFGEENEPEYLSNFATQLAKAEKTVALLARFAGGHLIFAQHPAAGKDMNTLLKQVLAQFAGKGGGTRDFARGKLSDAAQAEKAVALAERLLFSK
ncbi:MAG TPA: DHHA1 domain-containing protein [Candidatus Acidoferrum sp.]|nr:DHHA1 domain-containing protein [Candidatus Acidoferrum sp.]